MRYLRSADGGSERLEVESWSQATQLVRAGSWIGTKPLSVDPVPLFLPTELQRDFTSQRFLAEQVGNHWFHRLEITGCAPLDDLPSHSKLLGRSRLKRPYRYRAQTSLCRTPRPPRRAPGLLGAAVPGRCGKRIPGEPRLA